ncbi:hypothetical protein OVA24_02305 [Luteolibacter sp. SL250]|uniref:hypothetical protein n=1 Tax=Luteolibacter sp. SL250 TaxID=2995170 RepID=UPI0022711AA5|nr:hypothetical protein [Luteolibacter sp. SL250]WAC20211.1 hypothetical protein OVA24_02305 [Luteolibacter sp. SL250]
MNLLFETIVKGSFLMDCLGVIGLGLISLSAVRLAQQRGSWGGTIMAAGAIALLTARLIVLFRNHMAAAGMLDLPGDPAARMMFVLPTFLLTLGLAGVVWGVWAHERWLREVSRG